MLRPPLPDDLGASFSVADARAAGVTASRLRASDLVSPFHGVRAVVLGADPARDEKPELELLRRVQQYACRMTEHEFFSHVTAAVLWGLPLPWRLVAGRPVEVSVHKPRRAPAGRGVAGHVVTPGLAFTVDHPVHGVPVTSPASTWAMLAGTVGDLRDLVAVADAVIRQPMHADDPPALATISALTAAVEAGRRPGLARLIAALDRVHERSRSRAETWLRLIIQDAGLPDPQVNYDVFEGGEWLGQVDLAYPEFKIAIEYEGEQHMTDTTQWGKDIRRYDRLIEAGWRVIRVTKDEVFADSRPLVLRIRRAIARVSR